MRSLRQLSLRPLYKVVSDTASRPNVETPMLFHNREALWYCGMNFYIRS